MKELPILFNGEMVRSILAGTKTQTRRLIKPQPPNDEIVGPEWFEPAVEDRDGFLRAGKPIFGIWDRHGEFGLKCPWLVGDHLWVREAWYSPQRPLDDCIGYAADADIPHGRSYRIRPSIHMPRYASRITLEITGIRAERLQDITPEDVFKEGIEPIHCGDANEENAFALNEFANLWNSINAGRPGCSWDANPWVWVLSLRRIKP